MKVLLSLLVGLAVFEATVDAIGQIVSSSSSVSSSSHTVTSSSSSSGGSLGLNFHPFEFPFPKDVANQHFDKCNYNGQLYEQGHHTLSDCQGFYCGPNGFAQIQRCGVQISVPGATCDEGVRVNPTAQFPVCCRKKYTCTITT